MIKEIITDEETLSVISDEIDCRKEGKLVREIVINLKDTIREHNLVSLSAPEIGEQRRLFVINFNGDLRSFVNPIITKISGWEMSKEQSPSIPDKKFILPRYNKLTAFYQTPLGETKSAEFVGLSAKIFQQMVDSLEGILLSDLGLEIDTDFEEASEEEQQEIIKMYLESLDIKKKEIEKEIAEDEDLTKVMNKVNLEEKIAKGDIAITEYHTGEEDKCQE